MAAAAARFGVADGPPRAVGHLQRRVVRQRRQRRSIRDKKMNAWHPYTQGQAFSLPAGALKGRPYVGWHWPISRPVCQTLLELAAEHRVDAERSQPWFVQRRVESERRDPRRRVRAARGGDHRPCEPRRRVHRQVERDEVGAAEPIDRHLLFRGVDRTHVPAVGAQPCRGRGDAERLPPHLVRADQQRAPHRPRNHCILRTIMAVAAADARPHDASFFGHPRGLATLFFLEMWERFSYYGMRALLILFMTAPVAAGGLGFDTAVAGAGLRVVTAMGYTTTLPGGWIADRLIGQRRAVLYGGMIIAAGHFSMAVQSLTTFYIGLTLIVIGTGFVKGNAAVIVGALYGENDARRDAGFSIYYMGINLGAFIAPLVCGYLGQRVNWHIGFAAAGVGMVLGIVQYLLGAKYLGDAGLHPAPAESPAAAARLRTRVQLFGALIIVVLVVVSAGMYTGALPITPGQIADVAGYLLLITTVVFFGWLFTSANWTPAERKRLYAIGV